MIILVFWKEIRTNFFLRKMLEYWKNMYFCGKIRFKMFVLMFETNVKHKYNHKK